MKQAAAAKTTHTVSGEPVLGIGSIALTFLDTTWRIATPVVLCTFVGIYADRHLGTKPFLTLLAVVIGFGAAVLLVKKQIQEVEKAEQASARKQSNNKKDTTS
jgi:uncharacterized membrane protein YfcA